MKKNGYTLIEIVIVIAIIALMALVAVPAFDKYNVNNNFESKAEEISVLFNKAYALSQSPVRIADAAGNEYSCDIISIRYDSGGKAFSLVLGHTGSLPSSCDGNVVDTIRVNDNPKLDVLSLDIGSADWVFKTSSVDLGVAGFKLQSINLSKTINFKLRNNNGFYIEHD